MSITEKLELEREEGREEGMVKGRLDALTAIVKKLYSKYTSIEYVVNELDLSVSDVMQYLGI